MKNILKTCIVDDDSIYQFTMVKTLESTKLPLEIMVFSDGEEAIDFKPFSAKEFVTEIL